MMPSSNTCSRIQAQRFSVMYRTGLSTASTYQEIGTERQGYAQPFMRPAVEEVRTGWESAFAGQLTDEQVKAVVTKVAFDIEGIAKQLAPVDTGNLKNSISVSDEMPGGGGGLWFSVDLPWQGGV